MTEGGPGQLLEKTWALLQHAVRLHINDFTYLKR